MLNKLSFKIGLLFFVFILIMETFLFFILYTNVANERINEVMDSLLARGNMHRDVLEDKFDTTTLEHVSLMESVSEFAVIIVDESGEVIISSDPIDKDMKNVLKHTDTNIVPTKGKVVEGRWDKEKYIATDSPVTINGEHKGHVFMFADTSNVKKVVSHISDQFIISGLIIVALTIATIFILSRFVTSPLIKMKEATEQLSRRKNTVELHTERKDELGELANSITKLSNDLEEMERERNEFLANISHELRTPLTYIKGYADIINRQDISREEIQEYIEIIREETEQLTLLIKNLFDLAKMDQNNFLINRERVILYDLIQTIVSLVTPVFVEKNIKLSTKCPKDVVAFVDPERFQQVLINILDNAKKHSHDGDQVLMEVTQKKEKICVAVYDAGEGIPKEDLPYIFDRLYRVEKSRSRINGGTGLGLPIAKEIVEAHGGGIKIFSECGKGTSVIIELNRG